MRFDVVVEVDTKFLRPTAESVRAEIERCLLTLPLEWKAYVWKPEPREPDA